MSMFVRPRTAGDLIAVEWDQNYCRERVTYAASANGDTRIAQFAVLGAILLGAQAAAASPKVGNAGNGAVNNATGTPGAPAGRYKAVFASANQYVVHKPDGEIDGEGVVGQDYAGTVHFHVAAGAQAFAIDDELDFDISYAVGSGKYVPLNFTGVDGSQNVAGIALASTLVPQGVDTDGDVLRRGPVILRKEELVWPPGATDQQIAAGLAQLNALNPAILCRTSG